MARPPVARISPQELSDRLASATPPIVLDVRGRSYRSSDCKITDAIRIDPHELPERYQILPHAQTIVAYCT